MQTGLLRTPFAPLLCGLLLAGTASADRIYLVAGDPIEDCVVVSETATEITYKEEERGKDQTVPTDEVLAIEFTRMPNLVEEGLSALDEDEPGAAFDAFDQYLRGHLEDRPERRFRWAPAFAAYKLIELNRLLGDLDAAVAAADRLIENFPDSRHAPEAYLVKAEVQAEQGDPAKAKTTLERLEKTVLDQDLSKRWSLEARLAKIQLDPGLKGDERRSELRAVESDAGGEFPLVRNRATMAIGESFLREAAQQGDGGAGALKQARDHFEEVIADPSADDEALAGAYTGLGDCLFQVAVASKDEADVRSSLMTFMRVVVLYRDQVKHAPKAMFYAGRCFNLLGTEEDNERADKLYSRVIRNYDGTVWADQARDFRGK